MEMERDHIDEVLAKVKKVDAPPFLFTRIQARLEDVKSMSKSQWVLIVTSLATLFIINAMVIRNSSATSKNDQSSISQLYQVNPSNQLYNE